MILLHVLGIEDLEWAASKSVWGWLILNGIVEYLFDASCAMAIYATSPIVVSVTAPLTIPLSMLVDRWLHPDRSMLPLDRYLSFGVLLVLLGTVADRNTATIGFVLSAGQKGCRQTKASCNRGAAATSLGRL